MPSIRTLTSLASALGALALAPAAFAQDTMTLATPADSMPADSMPADSALAQSAPAQVAPTPDAGNPASARHFSVVGGVAMQKTTGSGIIGGQRVDFDSEVAPALSASYNVNDNLAIEAWGAGKSGHRVRTAAGKLASVDSQPVALSGQYHFRAADRSVRPFVGLGYYQANIDHEATAPSGALAGQRLGMTTPKGAMATAGVDLNLTPTWFARADARYLNGGSDIAVDGAKAGHANLNPVVVGVGIGARF